MFEQATVNRLVQKHFIFMLEVKDGDVYRLVDHWKFLDWRTKSPREFLLTGSKVEDGFYYYIGQNQFHKV